MIVEREGRSETWVEKGFAREREILVAEARAKIRLGFLSLQYFIYRT